MFQMQLYPVFIDLITMTLVYNLRMNINRI